MVSIEKFYGTPWCSDCKRTKTFLGEQRIRYEDAWIDISVDEEAALYVESVNNGKRKVPTMIFSDGSMLVEPSNAKLAEKLGLKQDLGHEFHDIMVIGGGPAGLTTALYAARDGFDVVVIEKGSLGGQASYTQHIDNYPGFPQGIVGGELSDLIVQQCERFGVEFLKATEVSELTHINGYLTARTSAGDEIGAKTVVIATGSKYRKLGVPGEDDLIGYKVHFCSTCDGPFYKDKEVAVIGGGDSAIEESLFLAQFATKVSIYARSEFSASKVLMDKVEEKTNIELVTHAQVQEIMVGEKKSLGGLRMLDRKNNEEFVINPEGVFLFIGLTPNAEIVKDMVDTDAMGFIKTGDNLMTRTEALYAAGDCRAGSTKQVVSAMGEGAAVAIHIREYLNLH